MSAFFVFLKKISLKRRLVVALIAFATAIFYMMATTPGKVSLAMLLVPFALMGVIVFEIASLVFVSVSKSKSRTVQRIVPAGVSTVFVTVLLLQSLNQLTWKDGLILLSLVVMVTVYLWRADFLNK